MKTQLTPLDLSFFISIYGVRLGLLLRFGYYLAFKWFR